MTELALASPRQLFDLFDRDGSSIRDVDADAGTTIGRAALGTLTFPSGVVVASDPFTGVAWTHIRAPIDPSAQVVVDALVLRFPDEVLVAALRLQHGAGPPERWEVCAPEGIEPEPGELYGYPVETGAGCFADPAAIEALETATTRYYDAGEGAEPLVDELFGDANRPWALYSIAPGLQIAAVAAGLGDGLYATWLGKSADGEPCALLTGFDLLSERVEVYSA